MVSRNERDGEKAVYSNGTQMHFGTDHLAWFSATLGEFDKHAVLTISTEPMNKTAAVIQHVHKAVEIC